LAIALQFGASSVLAEQSVARQWNEELLEAIRHDFARPTVHARNLFHVSAAMWDAWVAFDPVANSWLFHEKTTAADVAAAREEAISYAAYRLLKWRFENSPGAATSLPAFDARMQALGYDTSLTLTGGGSPAALGNRIARAYIDFGLTDGANEANDYANRYYKPVNPALIGVAQRDDKTLTANMLITSGPMFGPNFDPDDMTLRDWGTLSMKVLSCEAATLDYSSVLAGFGEGALNLERLTSLYGLDCE
jgi:hypothetical protein